MKSRYKFILISVAMIFLCNLSAWFISKNYFTDRIKEVVAQKTKHSQERTGDLANSIQRNLNYLHGIPDLFTQLLSVKRATSRFGKDIKPSTLPVEKRKELWTKDDELNQLSKFLTLAKFSLNVDIIYVVNASGDCIAASNWNTKGSTIGTNFIDREYFSKNKDGQRGMQYAVGKTTQIPGLYFSTPIMVNDHFMGAVIAKVDVPNLSFLIKDLDAFIADENGVIVLARDKPLEMRSLPGATVANLPISERIARYRRNTFPIYQVSSFGSADFPTLMSVQDESVPHVISSMEVPIYGMKAFVADEMPEYSILKHEAVWFSFLLGVSGSVLILIVNGVILYVASVKATEVALARANLAERRIISISEDTQKQIGQELHDDLGQLLTGTAFMAEVLSNKLCRQGIAEFQDASKITSFINEAISKTRALAHGLYPVELKEAGLPAMLSKLARNTESIYPIKCEFINECQSGIEDSIVVINLFRITQEAVNNSIKHGSPTKITIKLQSDSQSIKLEIIDNGFGITTMENKDARGGVGLQSMKYRASLLGGKFELNANPTGGTIVSVSLTV